MAVGGLGNRIMASAGTQNFERSEFIGHQQLEPFESNKSEPLRDLTSAQSHQRSEAMSAFSQDFGDVFLRTSKDLCQCADFQPLRVFQQNHDTLSGWEAAQACSEGGQSASFLTIRRRRLVEPAIFKTVLNQDSIQPDKDRTSTVQLIHGSKCIKEYLFVDDLRRVFGARQRKDNPHHHRIVGADQFLKRGRVTTLRCEHQLGTAQIS